MSAILALAGVIALMASAPAQASVAADSAAYSAPAGAADLQKRVDEVLATYPGGTQVSATEIKYNGYNVTVDPYYSEKSRSTINAISCPEWKFCIIVRGTRFDFWQCGTYPLYNWWDLAPYNNNQSTNTTAVAYGQNGTTVVFTHTAKGSGSVNVSPWWYFKPC
ncbi:hypothetical protein [Rhizocola hellebori]|nr:hypothetical protein [Rhizocola hellebori]